MPTRTALFLDTTTGSLKGISSTLDQALIAGVRSGAATDLTLDRAGAAGTTVTIGATAVTYGSTLAALNVGSTTFALANTTATTVNLGGGATTAVNIGNAVGTTTIAGIGTVAGVLNANGTSIVTDDVTFALLNTTATTINFGGAATAINMGIAGGLTSIAGSVSIAQNLTVVGTTFTTNSETVLINDNHLYLNNAYTVAVAQTGGLVANRLPTGTASTVAAGGFAAGVDTTSNPTVTIAAAAVFAVGDIIQVSAATNPANNGLFEVLSNATAVMTIRGIGLTATVEDFTQNQFVTSAGAAGAVTKINVSVIRANTAGTFWEVGYGSATPVTFADLATGASSGWTDDGAVVRLSTVTDNVGIGTATPGTNKVNITNDTVGDRNLLLVEVASQTAAPFRIETSAAGLEFQVAIGGDTTTAGDLAVNGGDVTTTAATATLFNATATTLSIGGAATALSLGAATGTLTIGNPTITGTNATALNLNGASPSIATTSTTASVFNATVTTLNIGGAGTTVSIGAATGTTTINNANTVVAGSLAANGAAITTDDTTFALLNTTATTINFGGAATTINAGAAASTFATGFNAVTSSQTTVSLFNTTTTTLNVGGAATTMSVGNSGGTVTLPGNLTVNGSVTLGDAAADNVAVNGEFTTGLIPDVTNTVSLGSATKRWASLFVTNLDSLSVGTTYVAASTITAARVVFKNATANEVAHADATSITSGSNKIVGVARAGAAATADVTVDYAGVVTMDAETSITITAGDLVYLSTAAATGEVTNVAPATAGQVVVVVGVAKTTSAPGGTFLAQLAPRTPFEIP